MRSGQRSKAFVLATTSVQLQKWGEVEIIYKTDCRALLIELGLREENTSVREKSAIFVWIAKKLSITVVSLLCQFLSPLGTLCKSRHHQTWNLFVFAVTAGQDF